MINQVTINNFGILNEIQWKNLGNINLIVGDNGSGKSFLLKALYTAMRTVESYQRGNDRRTESEILVEKLYWTFQSDKIGDLVRKSATKPLEFQMTHAGKEFSYQFGKDTTKSIQSLKNKTGKRDSNSIFLPSKEVLSMYHIILESRENDKVFGYDDTYLDLVRALTFSRKGKNSQIEFVDARKSLEDIFGGKVEYDETDKKWLFKKGNQKFAIGVTAEGIKKIAMLESLLANYYLDINSIIFIDELEAALHPTAIVKLLDIIGMLADRGLQFFIATHSYFVVKKMHLMAMENKRSIPFVSLSGEPGERAVYDDLINGMPDNEIINESIRLYEQQMNSVWGDSE